MPLEQNQENGSGIFSGCVDVSIVNAFILEKKRWTTGQEDS